MIDFGDLIVKVFLFPLLRNPSAQTRVPTNEEGVAVLDMMDDNGFKVYIRKPTLNYNSLGIATVPSVSPLSNDAPDYFIRTKLKRLTNITNKPLLLRA